MTGFGIVGSGGTSFSILGPGLKRLRTRLPVLFSLDRVDRALTELRADGRRRKSVR